MPSNLPRLIALCGNPDSGKTTAAQILCDRYGYTLLDDGLPLRKIAMEHLGLTPDQVFTQDGKMEMVDIAGRKFAAREILGEIGNAFEEKFGEDSVPYMSLRGMDPEKRYVMGSVRREQGFFWKKRGAAVFEIRRATALPSKFAFDRFNSDAVDHVVPNDDDLGMLAIMLDAALTRAAT